MRRGRGQPRPQWSALDWLKAQRCPIADHPLEGEYMANVIELAEANSTKEVAAYFLAVERRRTIVARDNNPKLIEAKRKQARKAAKMLAQGMEVVDG